jgi:hypothetical protein
MGFLAPLPPAKKWRKRAKEEEMEDSFMSGLYRPFADF